MDKDKNPTLPEGALTWELAHQALRQGQPLQAEGIGKALVEAAAARWGAQSHHLAQAHSELAMIQMSLHEFAAAARSLRAAWEIPAQEPDAVRARLTHGMNLGSALQLMGQHQEAEQVLRQSLALRQEFYGEDHPGYAYGLNALADLLSESGSLQEAHDLAEDALGIFWQNEHPHVAETLILLAWIRAAGQAEPIDHRLGRLPEDLQEVALREAWSRAQRTRPEVAHAALLALWRWSQEQHGPHAQHSLQLGTYVINLARGVGEHEARLEVLQALLEAFREVGTDEQEFGALLGHAMTYGDMGQHEQADAFYREAVTLAQRMEAPDLLSRGLRNHGLYLAQQERRQEAEESLRRALEEAQDGAVRGRALVALGIFQQHDGLLEPARAMLEEAMGLLPPEDSDAVCGRRHLVALVEERSCGCGDPYAGISATLTQMVQADLPEGLLDQLQVQEDGQIAVHLARAPREEELELLQRAIEQASARLRRAQP